MGLKLFSKKDEILSLDDVRTEEVEVPEWAGTVLVRGMTGIQRDRFEESLLVRKGKGKNETREVQMTNIRAKLVAQCVVDRSGSRLFSDADIPALGRKSAAALERIFDKARELSGMSEEDIEDLAGDLEPAALSDSPSS